MFVFPHVKSSLIIDSQDCGQEKIEGRIITLAALSQTYSTTDTTSHCTVKNVYHALTVLLTITHALPQTVPTLFPRDDEQLCVPYTHLKVNQSFISSGLHYTVLQRPPVWLSLAGTHCSTPESSPRVIHPSMVSLKSFVTPTHKSFIAIKNNNIVLLSW